MKTLPHSQVEDVHIISNRFAATSGSRESSPPSHFREPTVQIVNDSEFSSPRKTYEGSSNMDFQEKPVVHDFTKYPNEQQPQLQQNLLSLKEPQFEAKTPSASAGSKIIQIAGSAVNLKNPGSQMISKMKLADTTDYIITNESEKPDQPSHRSFAKSVIEMIKPTSKGGLQQSSDLDVGQAPSTCQGFADYNESARSTINEILNFKPTNEQSEPSQVMQPRPTSDYDCNTKAEPARQSKSQSQGSFKKASTIVRPAPSKNSQANMTISARMKAQGAHQSGSQGKLGNQTSKVSSGRAPTSGQTSFRNSFTHQNYKKPRGSTTQAQNSKGHQEKENRKSEARSSRILESGKSQRAVKKLEIQTENLPKVEEQKNNAGTAGAFTSEKFKPISTEREKTLQSPAQQTLKILENRPADIEDCKNQSIFHEHDESNSNTIKVAIRVRPLSQRELQDPNQQSCINIENGTIVELDKAGDLKTFKFDFVGDQDIDQLNMFNHIAKPIADSCLQGYNGTIFAYGQTGAGKTYTIQGPQGPVLGLDNESESQGANYNLQSDMTNPDRGIMQRSFEYIFQCIEAEQSMIDKKGNGSALQFLVKCSYLEIYNEQIMDLLEPQSINLNLREDISKGVYVEGLVEETVSSLQDMMALIAKGAKNRHTGATSMNRSSSRSHSVLTTIIESKSRSSTGVWNLKQARFHIIDLAGSERQKQTQTFGDRLKEAGMINRSLSALGNVINSLVDVSEGKNRFVPYRDSKLTFILRDSLGGNSKTVIIANISPSQLNLNETLSTLKFAQRAKLIQNKAVINEDSSGTIILLKNEIKKLKKDLNEQIKQVNLLRSMAASPLGAVQSEGGLPSSLLCRKCSASIDINEVLGSNKEDSAAGEDAYRLKQRLNQCESVLSSKLFDFKSNLAMIDNLKSQNQKLTQSIEIYEQENQRLKMIEESMAFTAVSGLEEVQDGKVEQVMQENALLKERLRLYENEVHPRILQLQADNAALLERADPVSPLIE